MNTDLQYLTSKTPEPMLGSLEKLTSAAHLHETCNIYKYQPTVVQYSL